MRYRRLRVEGGIYFFTVVTYRREPIFASDSAVQLLLEVLDHVARQHPFETHASVVLHDHLHTLWTLPEGDAEFSLRWRLIKERFTRRYRQRTVREMPVWQNRFWEHFIRDERDLARHRDYIHLNPVHHGYVTAPGAWPHSTFRGWVDRGVYDKTWGSDEMPELPEWALRHE